MGTTMLLPASTMTTIVSHIQSTLSGAICCHGKCLLSFRQVKKAAGTARRGCMAALGVEALRSSGLGWMLISAIGSHEADDDEGEHHRYYT